MATIGERIRKEREAQDIPRAELAAAAGMAKTTLADLEYGASKSTTKLHKIAAKLGVRVEWLETGRGPKAPEPHPVSEESPLQVAPDKASQSVRLDPPTIASVSRVLKQVCGLVGWEFDLEDPLIAELFSASYEWRTADKADDVALATRVVDFIRAREARNGGRSGSAVVGGVQEGARRTGAA